MQKSKGYSVALAEKYQKDAKLKWRPQDYYGYMQTAEIKNPEYPEQIDGELVESTPEDAQKYINEMDPKLRKAFGLGE